MLVGHSHPSKIIIIPPNGLTLLNPPQYSFESYYCCSLGEKLWVHCRQEVNRGELKEGLQEGLLSGRKVPL